MIVSLRARLSDTRLMSLMVLVGVAVIYLPVRHAGFVWDDIIDFQQMAWLRAGNDWTPFLFRGYHGWTNYFRPLVIALYALEIRAFDNAAAPMHLVSLAFHLINTALVGLLARRLLLWHVPASKATLPVCMAMACYGVQPALAEPVTWISCQFDLVATMLMLTGAALGMFVGRKCFRAAAVSFVFFLALCAKESALIFPAVLAALDWLAPVVQQHATITARLRAWIGRYWQTCLGMIFVLIVYFACRQWALGSPLAPGLGDGLSVPTRLRQVAYLYLHYWRVFFWPMTDLSPIHPVGAIFARPSALALARVLLAGLIAALGAWLAAGKRWAPAGAAILAVTVAMLPVLHIANVAFDTSLYHERYAMTALAFGYAMMPLVCATATVSRRWRVGIKRLVTTLIALWIVFAAATTCSVIPLWSSNVKLWQWALITHPDSTEAKDGLLSAYMLEGAYERAARLVTKMMDDKIRCINCMLNAASLGITQRNLALSHAALDSIADSPDLATNPFSRREYIFVRGQLLFAENDLTSAEQAFRAAIELSPLDSRPQFSLALTLGLLGRTHDAEVQLDRAMSLLPPAERERKQQIFDHMVGRR